MQCGRGVGLHGIHHSTELEASTKKEWKVFFYRFHCERLGVNFFNVIGLARISATAMYAVQF
jgi:hypothetical protein